MNQQKIIQLLDRSLREFGYVFYVPTLVWVAYTEGLLKDRYVTKYLNAVPKMVQEKYKVFIEGQSWIGDRKGGHLQEAGILPQPTFTEIKDWKTAITHCGLRGVGAGKNTKSRRYHTIYTHDDGSVSEIVKIAIHLSAGAHPMPGGSGFLETPSEIESKLEKILGSSYSSFSSYTHPLCYAILQVDFFTKERVSKVRRRIEDKLRKGTPDDVIRAAKSLGVR